MPKQRQTAAEDSETQSKTFISYLPKAVQPAHDYDSNPSSTSSHKRDGEYLPDHSTSLLCAVPHLNILITFTADTDDKTLKKTG